MKPISFLEETINDPIEFAGITLPSAAIVAGLFAYREQIYPELRLLPDPFTGNVFGALIFIVATLIVSTIIKQLSHDLLNWMYDKLVRPRKLLAGKGDTWFDRAVKANLLTTDPKRSKYEDAMSQLDKLKNPVLPKVKLLELQSKLSRSTALVLLVFAALLVAYNWLLAVFLVLLAWLMWKIFCDFRWQASEALYGALFDACAPGGPPTQTPLELNASADHARG
jgi:hypothetical protein